MSHSLQRNDSALSVLSTSSCAAADPGFPSPAVLCISRSRSSWRRLVCVALALVGSGPSALADQFTSAAPLPVVQLFDLYDGRHTTKSGSLRWGGGFTPDSTTLKTTTNQGNIATGDLAAANGRFLCLAATWASSAKTGFLASDTPYAIDGGSYFVVSPVNGTFSNLAVRGIIPRGGLLIPGFTTTGPSVRLLARVAGPALTQFGVSGVMANPRLQVYVGQTVFTSNEDWGETAENRALVSAAAVSRGAFAFPDGSRDSATVFTLPTQNTTIHIPGASDAAGVILFELYPLPAAGTARGVLLNTAALMTVATNDSPIFGISISGGPMRIILRAVGPALAQFDVIAPLADPRITVYEGARVIATNDDWSSTVENRDRVIEGNTISGSFPLTPGGKDAALVLTLAPGQYTAVVSGTPGSGGPVLLEAYSVPFPVSAGFDDDFDRDGLPNAVEEMFASSPTKADSNGDGVPDGTAMNLSLPVAQRVTLSPNQTSSGLTLLTP